MCSTFGADRNNTFLKRGPPRELGKFQLKEKHDPVVVRRSAVRANEVCGLCRQDLLVVSIAERFCEEVPAEREPMVRRDLLIVRTGSVDCVDKIRSLCGWRRGYVWKFKMKERHKPVMVRRDPPVVSTRSVDCVDKKCSLCRCGRGAF